MERNRTPQHGNYHGYYLNRPFASPDPRLRLLPPDFFASKRVLDVGCNEGYVSCEIAQSWGASEVLGVDVDEELVRLASQRRRVLWSLQEPVLHDLPLTSSERTHSASNGRAQENGNGSSVAPKMGKTNYFPQCMPHMFGTLPLPPAPTLADGKHVFPYNVSFRPCNWAQETLPEDAEGWDVILLLSVVKWIHLNGEDTGLSAFFRKAYDALRRGGRMVLELQDWEGYRKAARTNPKLKENYKSLVLRPEDFERVLMEEVGFERVEHLTVVGEGFRKRPIDVYYKA